ncbi:MAG TPA: glycosyl hydrolase family 28-related protein [Pirellulales bacterium]|nr:glycosyl hydrolase family 28-related protein [Pirellulales bacterium]
MIREETRSSVDVRQLGAKGDGETDDTAAFQAAVEYLNGKPGRIIFPSGPSDERHPSGAWWC